MRCGTAAADSSASTACPSPSPPQPDNTAAQTKAITLFMELFLNRQKGNAASLAAGTDEPGSRPAHAAAPVNIVVHAANDPGARLSPSATSVQVGCRAVTVPGGLKEKRPRCQTARHLERGPADLGGRPP
jgi:hypothetical protein